MRINSTKVVTFTKVRLPYGWLGNMSAHVICWTDGRVWRTAEHLFQALRFTGNDEVQKLIHDQKSPMGAKMMAKKYLDKVAYEPRGGQDLEAMRFVLAAKADQHPELMKKLLEIPRDFTIIEDVTSRPNASGVFWGAQKLPDGSWNGFNHLGRLWMQVRDGAAGPR